jgi:hypothetical protein
LESARDVGLTLALRCGCPNLVNLGPRESRPWMFFASIVEPGWRRGEAPLPCLNGVFGLAASLQVAETNTPFPVASVQCLTRIGRIKSELQSVQESALAASFDLRISVTSLAECPYPFPARIREWSSNVNASGASNCRPVASRLDRVRHRPHHQINSRHALRMRRRRALSAF